MRLLQIPRGPHHSLKRKQTDNLLETQTDSWQYRTWASDIFQKAVEEVPENLQTMSKHIFQNTVKIFMAERMAELL